jgi:general secretion pathway protein M
LTPTSASEIASVRRQAAAGAVYFGVVMALWASSLWFIGDLRSKSEEIAAAGAQLEQLSNRSRPKPPASISSAASMSGSPFLAAQTITIAGAALQERIAAAVAKAGGTLVSSEVDLEGAEAKNGFVRLSASAEVSQPAVQRLLYDIEAGMPYLFIDELSIQSPVEFGESETGRMRMTVAVVGQWRRTE